MVSPQGHAETLRPPGLGQTLQGNIIKVQTLAVHRFEKSTTEYSTEYYTEYYSTSKNPKGFSKPGLDGNRTNMLGCTPQFR